MVIVKVSFPSIINGRQLSCMCTAIRKVSFCSFTVSSMISILSEPNNSPLLIVREDVDGAVTSV